MVEYAARRLVQVFVYVRRYRGGIGVDEHLHHFDLRVCIAFERDHIGFDREIGA